LDEGPQQLAPTDGYGYPLQPRSYSPFGYNATP
jgi:hypothetical protein